MSLSAYLNAPIPRKRAFAAVIISSQAYAMMLYVAKLQQEVIKEQNERLTVASEIMDFLLERARDSDLQELDEKLEYWRIVRGFPPRSEDPLVPEPDCDCPAHLYRGRECTCNCLHNE